MADPTDTRGVSEVVGFILVFSLVLGTITLVYASGISGLDNTRDAERITNAERAFDVLANNFQQMARGEAPNRATEMKLAEAQLSTSTEREMNISADGVDPAVANSSTIRYNPGTDTSIVYENGAVIRVDNGNAIMLEEPDFLFDNGTVVVRYIELKGGGQSIGGTSTTVLVRAERTTSEVLVNRESSTGIEIKMQTHEDRAGVWEEYYEEQIAAADSSWSGDCDDRDSSVGGSDTTQIECKPFNADKLAVSKVQIEVELT